MLEASELELGKRWLLALPIDLSFDRAFVCLFPDFRYLKRVAFGNVFKCWWRLVAQSHAVKVQAQLPCWCFMGIGFVSSNAGV